MGLLVAGNNPAAVKTAERNIFTATASQTTFTITQGYQAGDIDVYLNGVRLVDTEDYVANNGTTVVLNSGATVGDSVVVVCFRPFQVADFYTKSEQDTRYVNATGDNTLTGNFVFDHTAAGGEAIAISRGGSYLSFNANYSATNTKSQITSDLPLAFAVGGNERVKIDTAGRVTMPYQPAFMATLTGNWTHPSGVSLVQGTLSAAVNVGSCYNATNRRFTAPVTGSYFVSACSSTVGSTGTFTYLSSEIWVNGLRRIQGGWDGGGSSYGKSSVSGVIYLNVGDYVEFVCEASKTFTMEGTNSSTFFSGHLIG